MYKAILTAALAAILCNQPGLAQQKAPMLTASGSFTTKPLPPSGTGPSDGFVHISMEKTFDGSLQGTSRLEMMASSDGTTPSGGYVALERFTGKLDGKSGGFILQHTGTMTAGSVQISVVVSPGSGTGDLAGISGTMEIRIEGNQHFYTLRYALSK
jgi:hypothetical protein